MDHYTVIIPKAHTQLIVDALAALPISTALPVFNNVVEQIRTQEREHEAAKVERHEAAAKITQIGD